MRNGTSRTSPHRQVLIELYMQDRQTPVWIQVGAGVLAAVCVLVLLMQIIVGMPINFWLLLLTACALLGYQFASAEDPRLDRSTE